jgi:hypothetical protein
MPPLDPTLSVEQQVRPAVVGPGRDSLASFATTVTVRSMSCQNFAMLRAGAPVSQTATDGTFFMQRSANIDRLWRIPDMRYSFSRKKRSYPAVPCTATLIR